MADVSTTLRINDQASSVLAKVAESANKAANAMEETGKTIDKAFDTKSPDKFASSAEDALKSVGNEADSLGDKIDKVLDGSESTKFASKMETGFNKAGEGAEKFQESTEGAGEAVEDLTGKTDELGKSAAEAGEGASSIEKIGNEGKNAGAGLGEANGQAINLISTLKTLAATAGVLKVANTVKDFFSDSISLGKDYTAQMSEVAAISGATGDDYKMLQDTARQYGATTVFSATQAAEALKYMSLAGWDANQSASALGGVLNLAAASGMELGQASDMVTDYLSAFGMEANQSAYFADMLSYAQSNSNTTAEQLGEAYLNSAAMLHSAGQDVETTTSFLEAMANQGTKGARAGTQLAAITRDITQKMETYSDRASIAKAAQDGFVSSTGNMNDILGKSAIAIGDTLIPVNDAKGNFRDLTDIMTDVEKATDGMGSAQKAAALSTTFTSDSTRGVNQLLTEGMDKVSQYEEALRNSNGAAEEAADTMNDNLKGDQANLNSAFEELQLQVFEKLNNPLREGTQYLTNTVIPILTDWVPEAAGKAAEKIGNIADKLKPLFEGILENPGKIADTFKVLGSGLLAFTGIQKISSTVNSFSKLGAAFSALKGAGDAASGLKAFTDSTGKIGGLAGGIGKLASAIIGHPWAAAGAAAAAAITGIVIAVKKYNEVKLEDNYADHFGKIALSAEQAEKYANQILDLKWEVNVDSSLKGFEKAQDQIKEAQDALKQNEQLDWKMRLGFTLDDSEISSYKQNIQTYVDDIQQSLSQQTLSMKLAISDADITLDRDGKEVPLNDLVNQWATQDIADASALSQKLTTTVQKALEDGIIDVNEQGAIDELRAKINNIMTNWNASESDAQMAMLTQEYGKYSGKDLTEDSFSKVVEKLSKIRSDAADKLKESNEKALAGFISMNKAGRLSDSELDSAQKQLSEWSNNQNAEALSKSLSFETNTVADAYADKLNENKKKIKSNTDSFFSDISDYLKNKDYSSVMNDLQAGNAISKIDTGIFSDQDQKNLKDLWKKMEPDTQSMTELLDQYREAGQKVPKAVMDGYNEAMQVGAAVGDQNAAWAVLADKIVQKDEAGNYINQNLMDAINKGTVGIPQELRDAINRASLEVTDEEIDIGDIQAKVGVKINEDQMKAMLNEQIDGLSAGEAVKEKDVTVGVNFNVESEMTAADLAQKLGVKVDDLINNNPNLNLKADTTLQVGTKVEVDKSGVTLALQQATEDTAKQVEQTTTEADTKVAVKVTPDTQVGNVDASQVTSAINQSLNGTQTANVSMLTNVTLQPGTVDTAQVPEGVNTALKSVFGSNLEAKATVDTELSKGTDNADEVYKKVGNAVKSAFSENYSANATVNVRLTANYSLANPSKTISFDGGASGKATVTAHFAEGGMVDTANMAIVGEDGPEYIIPVGDKRRDRGIDLWTQAGKDLGVPGFAEGGMVGSDTGMTDAANIAFNDPLNQQEQDWQAAGYHEMPYPTEAVTNAVNVPPSQVLNNENHSYSETTTGISKDINLNINGKGNMKIDSNMSKEDVVDILTENVKDVLMNIVSTEMMEEGEQAYEY